ncbi:uncharacterized protein TrAFT101_010747 [Trichoderma asperellum]|uniref:Apple domain-containing protein n=1 Tax=Trichoderma asperellum (strain ATCC 204424 / CBS 433.97 / NBRC 101777) TaxID=1042311 RepID=A0A2T3YRG2_TRIA4|nr:hypothetical protein M441DRAFT_63014 [Trichoderma asperellum CBS 433.97]PTB35106.1 hypothetical protein M441DRAFT_63014 [Trichoderma asperellum CBS 433.97]UKZ95940.1 hypothetical protein TrAFT101_010747 [Trichoderma asperellum]
MQITPFWASIALLRVLPVLAQTTPTPTPTSAAPSCTASLVTSLCSYPTPGLDFAVASDGKPSCWNYCNAHPPCNFVIFAAGNPLTGTGTCWLYPGESFDASAGSSDCANPYLSVYDQPVCRGSGTPTSGSCAATATPSAVASVCGYPTPPDDCFSTCTASENASDCLSQCAKADSCSYVVFNPHNPDNSPYSSGTCWMYPSGTYDARAATTCSGPPEQFVYKNECPKPSPSSSPASSSASSSATARSSTETTKTGSTASGTVGAGTAAVADAALATTSKTSASTALRLTNPLAIYMAVLLWQGIA